jgi:hypothetical protein
MKENFGICMAVKKYNSGTRQLGSQWFFGTPSLEGELCKFKIVCARIEKIKYMLMQDGRMEVFNCSEY